MYSGDPPFAVLWSHTINCNLVMHTVMYFSQNFEALPCFVKTRVTADASAASFVLVGCGLQAVLVTVRRNCMAAGCCGICACRPLKVCVQGHWRGVLFGA